MFDPPSSPAFPLSALVLPVRASARDAASDRLIVSFKTAVSRFGIESTLKKTVDKLPALSGKTVTGGRIDLGRALGSVG